MYIYYVFKVNIYNYIRDIWDNILKYTHLLRVSLEVALALKELWSDEPLNLWSLGLLALLHLTAHHELAHIVLKSKDAPPFALCLLFLSPSSPNQRASWSSRPHRPSHTLERHVLQKRSLKYILQLCLYLIRIYIYMFMSIIHIHYIYMFIVLILLHPRFPHWAPMPSWVQDVEASDHP